MDAGFGGPDRQPSFPCSLKSHDYESQDYIALSIHPEAGPIDIHFAGAGGPGLNTGRPRTFSNASLLAPWSHVLCRRNLNLGKCLFPFAVCNPAELVSTSGHLPWTWGSRVVRSSAGRTGLETNAQETPKGRQWKTSLLRLPGL